MRKLFEVLRVGWHANEGRNLYNYVPRRGARFQELIKWVKPEKKPIYHPARSGDLVLFPTPKYDSPYMMFKDSKELETANEYVKKIFSLRYQTPRQYFEMYEHELVEKVKSHPYDTDSDEVKIAKRTARIRFYESIISKRPTRHSELKQYIKKNIDWRKKYLKLLRLRDYKKFEWLLDKLDLEFRPAVPVTDNKVTRKKSLTRLAQLQVAQIKEERLAALKKEFDEKKIPFLEKKIMKLKEIKEKEEKYKLPVTVTDEDIQECIEKLEQVKIEVAERAKKGYKRKIHPYFLEPYDEEILWQKEKAAEELRERKELEIEKIAKSNT